LIGEYFKIPVLNVSVILLYQPERIISKPVVQRLGVKGKNSGRKDNFGGHTPSEGDMGMRLILLEGIGDSILNSHSNS